MAERDIIVIDDEDPAPPAEVVELQDKVASLERQLDGARKRADHAFTQKIEVNRQFKEYRTEVEKVNKKERLVAKTRIELELSQQIESLKAELSEAGKREDDSRRRERDLTRENEELRKELAESKSDRILAQQLEEERLRYIAKTDELTQQRGQSSQRGSLQPLQQQSQYAMQPKRHSMESAPVPEKMPRLNDHEQRQPLQQQQQQQQFGQQRQPYQMQQPPQRHSMDSSPVPNARFDDRQDRQQYGLQRQPPSQMLQQQRSPPRMSQQPAAPAAAAAQASSPAPIVAPTAAAPIKPSGQVVASDPAHNLFQLCDTDSEDAVTLDKAIEWMSKALKEFKRENIKGRPQESVRCELCKFPYKGIAVIDHFLIQRHGDLVRAKGAAVSMTALTHWLELLKPMEAAAADAAGPMQ